MLGGVLCISILTNTLTYINFLYFSSYTLSIHKLNAINATYLYLVVTFAYAAGILLFGFLSDYYNKKIMIITACALTIGLAYPLFGIIVSGSLLTQFVAQAGLSMLIGMILGPFASVLATSFPTQIRYTGLSMTLNIAASVFGGTAPMVCSWLTKLTGTPLAPAFYVMLMAGIALGAIMYVVMPGRHAMSSFSLAHLSMTGKKVGDESI
jgi:MHS family proline/betaine transporter-like MFS transporter